MSGLLQDVRYALRRLRKSPRFALLTQGVGPNTAILTGVDPGSGCWSR